MKRPLDTILAILLLGLLSPLFLATSLLIRLDSRGPVFFRQKRVGKGGRVFTLWKFRSMHTGAEDNGAVWAEEIDPRVTRAGRWLRAFRLDELPQLVNVLKGDMSLVGPRPERPEFVQRLKDSIPEYDVRHAVRPGITGLAQVNYPYGASVEDAEKKLAYDLAYIRERSFRVDAGILLKSLGVMLRRQGAR